MGFRCIRETSPKEMTMTPPSRVAAAVAVLASAFTLSIAASAAARAGDASFQQTFPVASTLCARVAANTEGKHLKRFASQAVADCTLLLGRFGGAQASVLALRAAVTPQLAADRAAIAGACPSGPQRALCRRTHLREDPAIDALRRQLKVATRSYYRTIELARERFWNAIHALPGERRLRADAPIAQLPS